MRTFQRVAWAWGVVLLMGSTAWVDVNEPTAVCNDEAEVLLTEEKGIQFMDASWAAVVKKAKAEKKIIFLDAYTSWCGPCKLMQKNVFTRADVGEVFNKHFINVKVDMEQGEGPQLARLFPLEFYPTLFFIDNRGEVVKKVVGYQSPENLIAIGKGVVSNQ